ncbi:hypothetical protein N9063_01330, partial [Deltaproteobacteria bacterium]|nr:hypothetical protein [Deltaproteobacteria bacterium]
HITYVIENPGQFNPGGETISWWNPQEQSRDDYQFERKTLDAGGIPWRWVWLIAAVIVVVIGAGLSVRHYMHARDPRDVAIKQELHHSEASKRMAALYAYADYHNPPDSDPVRLKRLLISSRATVEKILQSRFSSSRDTSSPTARESKQLYRKIKRLSDD